MSYILEALHKSQREHARGSVPTLQGAYPSTRPLTRRVGPLVAALLLGAAVALLAAGYLLAPQLSGAAGSVPSSAPKDVRPAQPETAAVGPVPARRDGVAPAAEADPPSRGRTDGERETADAPRKNGKTTTPKPPPKAWSELPAEIRGDVGNLVLNIHVYSERPERRFVFINEHQYAEGDVLDEGPTLEAIDPKGLVLAYRGERFWLGM